MTEHDIAKALEVWSLQSTLDFSILMGFFAFGLSLIGPYGAAVAKRLTLRVSIEIWDALLVIMVDLALTISVLLGFVVLNPDVMADIKMAVPFVPLATVLFAYALVMRIFRGGHQPGTAMFRTANWFMAGGALLNIIGYTMVMEAPSGEYLALHPSAFWTGVKTHLRSNASPAGLELAWLTFWICFPLLIAAFAWAFGSVINKTPERESDA